MIQNSSLIIQSSSFISAGNVERVPPPTLLPEDFICCLGGSTCATGRPKIIMFQSKNPHFLLKNLHLYIKTHATNFCPGFPPWKVNVSSFCKIHHFLIQISSFSNKEFLGFEQNSSFLNTNFLIFTHHPNIAHLE